MGFYIRSLNSKKSHPRWKLQFISYKKKDLTESNAKRPKKEWDLPKERWRTLGFHSHMRISDARARARQLNAQANIKRQEERIKKIAEAEYERKLQNQATLPSEFVLEFEQRFIRQRDSETKEGRRRKSRAMGIWKAAQQMIATIHVDPSEWLCYTPEIYDYFYERKFSIRYINSILKLANLWGYYICRKLARPFLAVPVPRGYERQRLLDAFYKKERKAKPSKPLLPKMLESKKESISTRNYNWLFLSIWLGLRPKEIDNLQNKDTWRVETLYNGRKVLWVYQTKIVALPPEDRWKPIPILFQEQEIAIELIIKQHFHRPLSRTVTKNFGREFNLYGGRKGFSDLMLSMEQTIENISIWMGHSSIERTWRNYKNKAKFHL